MEFHWIDLFPQILLTAGGFLIFCVGAFWKARSSPFLFGMAIVAVLAAGIDTMLGSKTSQFGGMLEVGGYGRLFTLLFILITLITILFAYRYGRERGFAGDEFYGLILFAAVGMTLVSGAVHWLVFLLGFEILSLSLYVLIAIRKGDPLSNEASLKYFIMGAVSSAFLLFGIAVLYATTGKLNIGESLAATTENLPMMLLSLSLILVGIGFKISLVPFHLWTPDVYQGAPAPVTAFLTTGSKVALFAALLRFSSYLANEPSSYFVPIIWTLAVVTMVVGNISALVQTHLKRLLAYSSIAQMGYLLMALLSVKQNGAPAIMFYLVVYAFMDLGAFGTVTMLSERRSDLDALEDYRGIGHSHPWQGALLSFCLFSLAGLPPTGGFIGKFALFQATLQARFITIAIIAILTVIVSIYFYLKVIVFLYMHPIEKRVTILKRTAADRIGVVLVFLLILCLGLVPSPLFSLIARMLPLSF
jgi:NADH-quinone oxidoreductase subunit N